MTSTIRLSVPQILECMGTDNRNYCAHSLGKHPNDCSTSELISHYICHSNPGMTVYGYDVSEPFDYAHGDPRNLRERSESDPHKPVYQHLERG